MDEKLRDTEDRASKWLELSEQTFKFACYAKTWFETGNIDEKRHILTALGSHQVLFNGKLTIDLEKPLMILSPNAEPIREDCKRLEPADFTIDKRKSERERKRYSYCYASSER